MRKFVSGFMLVLAIVLVVAAFGATSAQAQDDNACWGQATKVFAQTGEMGKHASQEETPRVGLRNLARMLYEDDAIADDSMQALGAFVAEAYGLSIEACR